MRILLTNDDGIGAAGIGALAEELTPLAEVVVVAPEGQRNAVGRTISLDRPVRYAEVGPHRFAVDGTPTDCVYLALHHILVDSPPDLVISGINHGANVAEDVTYSGTVGAAMEACQYGVRAAALSQVSTPDHRPGSLSAAARFARAVLVPLLERVDLRPGTFLNVNHPLLPAGAEEPVPWRLTRQGHHAYTPQVRRANHPRDKACFWLGGNFRGFEPIEGTDHMALQAGFASVTPMSLDLTADHLMAQLEQLRAADHRASDAPGRGE